MNGARSFAAELHINGFESADEIENGLARIRSTGGVAKVRAAAKRAVVVDLAAVGFRVEQWARTVGRVGKFLAARRTKGFGGEERFALSQLRGQTGHFELAALGPNRALALDGPFGEVGIDFPHLS